MAESPFACRLEAPDAATASEVELDAEFTLDLADAATEEALAALDRRFARLSSRRAGRLRPRPRLGYHGTLARDVRGRAHLLVSRGGLVICACLSFSRRC